jgi:GNAT superfamily N-acetyltransferase
VSITVREDAAAFAVLLAEVVGHAARAAQPPEAYPLVAFRDGRPVARVAAIVRDGDGLLGWFEARDDQEAVRELLLAAVSWLRQRGAAAIVGPMDGDTWHRYRINAGPFDLPPFLLEPVNPPYYARLWESAGFTVIESYSSKRIDDVGPLAARLAPTRERLLLRGYRFRTIDPARLSEELGLVYELSLEIFRANAFYSDISRDDFLKLYEGIERLLVPELVWFASDADGNDAGFIFAYPDTAAGVVNYKTIGVTDAYRRTGLASALQSCAYDAALARGLRIANHCLMREGNASQSLDGSTGYPFRRYLLYGAA